MNVPKKQKASYSGKKKRHTIKSQVVVDKTSQQIICTDFCEGKRHDFKLFKDSNLKIKKSILLLADSGYQGIMDVHANSKIPIKSSKKHPLTKEERKENRELSISRILVENVIGRIKKFKITSDKYRDRRRRFNLRFNLISGIVNYENPRKLGYHSSVFVV